MTRVVAKAGAKDLVPTSAQSGALYVGSLPVEKNVLAGLDTKLKSVSAALCIMSAAKPSGKVFCGSSLRTGLADESVDYIFTDPPFGDNIQYSEVNFIAESWLGETTKQEDEAIVSKHQGKSVARYQGLLTAAFQEANRILKKGRSMTVVFHSASREVWDALMDSFADSGFVVERTTRLAKEQGSFKQTTTKDFVRGDCVILLSKGTPGGTSRAARTLTDEEIVSLVERRLAELGTTSEEHRQDRIHSWLVATCVQEGLRLSRDASAFYALLRRNFSVDGGLVQRT
jgi:adenine-specific DNA methylase